MSKEGYLQLKIGNLEEKLKITEERITNLLDKIKLNENKAEITLNELSKFNEEQKEYAKSKEKQLLVMREIMEKAEMMAKTRDSQIIKSILKFINAGLEEARKDINFKIADNMAQNSLLCKLLVKKGIFTLPEYVKEINEHFDEIRDYDLKTPAMTKLELIDPESQGDNNTIR